MPQLLGFIRLVFSRLWNSSVRFSHVFAARLFLCSALCISGFAQNTTISGAVYDPRTTASSLPLPSVLVYITTGTVPPLPSGVQCLTYSAPQSAVSYAYTAVDGTFTLENVPENSTYTLVIQAGKWRRQFTENVAAVPLTGLALHMPANHAQGNIPFIAISTGSADGAECVLRNMGIADAEFTDDNGTVNPGGHIHFYKGSGQPGTYINSSTPTDAALMGNLTTLNGYDVVMFPCQGIPASESGTEQANLVRYANAGGRVFATHYSFVWLDPDSPYESQFPPVANWSPNQNYPQLDPGIATVNTSFTDGSTLAQWLENAGAIYENQPDQIQIGTLRHDLNSVIPPTQSWLTLNDPKDNNPVMQLTFNTPVGASAANQCGRVLFNEYHVVNFLGVSKPFPTECPTSDSMNAQEKMLEYALFDLSAFVEPVVVPTLSLAFNPSPLSVKQGDTGVQVTVDATNTSADMAIDSSAVLTIALPAHITATAITDATGRWNCALGTLTCTRSTSIPSSTSDSITLTLSVGTYSFSGLTRLTGLMNATVSSPTFSNNVTASDTVVFRQQPPITWATPAPILYGAALSTVQLDATSPLQGTFTYSPAAGTILAAGPQTLQVTFTPDDLADYTVATGSVTLTVVPATSGLTIISSTNPAFLSNSVTFTATMASLAGSPTGSVTFYDGMTQIGSGAVAAGVATFSSSALTMGTHSISAVYSGDANYQPAASGTLQELIEDFTIALAGSDAAVGTSTVYPGTPAYYPLVITPVGGPTLPAAINLTITGLPAGASAIFSPVSVAANSGIVKLTLQVNPQTLSASKVARKKRPLPVAWALLLLPIVARLRKASSRWSKFLSLGLMCLALTLGFTACGGITYTPKDFSITVTATSGSLSHSTEVKLTVQ